MANKYFLDDIEVYKINNFSTNVNLITDTQSTALGTIRRDTFNIQPNKNFSVATNRLSREKADELINYIYNSYEYEHKLYLPYSDNYKTVYIVSYSEDYTPDNEYKNEETGEWEYNSVTLNIELQEKGVVL